MDRQVKIIMFISGMPPLQFGARKAVVHVDGKGKTYDDKAFPGSSPVVVTQKGNRITASLGTPEQQEAALDAVERGELRQEE